MKFFFLFFFLEVSMINGSENKKINSEIEVKGINSSFFLLVYLGFVWIINFGYSKDVKEEMIIMIFSYDCIFIIKEYVFIILKFE